MKEESLEDVLSVGQVMQKKQKANINGLNPRSSVVVDSKM